MSIGPVQAAEFARPAQQFNVPDGFEPNDTAPTAKFLPQTGSSLTFATIATTQTATSAADDDWFLVTLDPNRSIVITTTSLAGANQGSLIVEGFSDTNGTVAAGSTSGQGNFSVLAITNNTGVQSQYRVRVRNQLGQSNPALFYGYRIDYLLNVIGAPTATPIGANPDAYEPNDTPNIAINTNGRSFINVGSTIPNVNFFPGSSSKTGGVRENGDVDWYFFYAKKSSHQGGTGGCYRVATTIQPGVDTQLFIYRGDQAPTDNAFTSTGLLASNDDVGVGRRESQVLFSVPHDGIFWIKVWNLDPTPRGAGQSYTLSLVELPFLAQQRRSQSNDACSNLTSTYLPVQVRNSAMIQPTSAVVTSTQPLQPGSQLLAGTVRIVTVFANGNAALNEADEYVELRNEGQTPAYLDGWRLKAIRNADNVQLDEYIFPGGAVIAANQTCRIYTNLPFGTDNCGFAGGFANDQPIWPPNSARAVLVNPQGQEMARFVY